MADHSQMCQEIDAELVGQKNATAAMLTIRYDRVKVTYLFRNLLFYANIN